MMELDINSIISTLIAGGAIYAGIRVEIRFLWREFERNNDEHKNIWTELGKLRER